MNHTIPSSNRVVALCGLLGAALLSAGAVQAAEQGEQEPLTIVSWGGVYQESQRKAYFDPYSEKTGIPIEEKNYDGDFSAVVEEVESGNTSWQVVDVTLADAIRGCREGYLEPIPPGILPPAPDGTPAMKDFLANSLHECVVGQYIWSTVWAYDKRAFDKAPESIEQVFDVEAFPGKRGMRKTPRNNVEWALMADGVAPQEVYSVLSTEQGKKRAFDQLDAIREQIRWWEDGDTPQKWLSEGEVAMATGYNGRIFNSIVKEDQPFDYIWDGQIWQIEAWVIPRGAPNLSTALDFITYATRTKSMAQLTEHVSYAPARKSSLPLVRQEYRSHMPTAPGNLRGALQNNFIWWSENQEDLEERFDAWLNQS
jgi:putative spermidine/putrescine transport system substrate-binding protein